MAEPLLRRTLSKLRGKDRSRRKTDPKLNTNDEAVKTALVYSSSSSSVTEMDVSNEDFVRHTQITVSKKQNWAKQSLVSRDSEPVSGTGSVLSEREGCSGKAQALKQAWSQRTLREEGINGRCKDVDRELSFSRGCQEPDRADASLPQLVSPPAAEFCPSSGVAKLSGQGVYLQHLERSSRAWVLSSGKTQAPNEAYMACITERRHVVKNEANIWYNPIPEEEDACVCVAMEKENKGLQDPWMKREADRAPEESRYVSQHPCVPDTPCAGVSTGAGVFNGANVATCTSGGSSGPGPADKSSSSSMMDKIKSPGTVRRLSMKMRKLPELRRKLSLRSSRNQRHAQGQAGSPGGADEASPPNVRKESSNVISRYHLDSSAPARPRRKSSRNRSASKGGYLSDGDSPELLPKQGPGQELDVGPSESGQGSPPTPPQHGWQESAASFRVYSLADQPRCAQRLSGLLTVHLLGVSELARTRAGKDVFCAIQVDGVTRARTALLTSQEASLSLNHTFNLELERARFLKLIVLTPSVSAASNGSRVPASQSRNRVCCLGAVAIPPLFKASRTQQLCVKLEPRGSFYVKLTLLQQWEAPVPRLSELPPPSVFGVELRRLVEKEAGEMKVPLIIQKCVSEIERRGLRVVGLYRLCGSAAVKKELRDAFERDSAAVTLSEELYPDVNVITGILKDYLRELPSPLITTTLYEVVLEAMCVRPACRKDDTNRSHSTVALLQCLPEPERATLSLLLDHLSLVASFSEYNLMTCQNLAVCFGPVLLTPTQDSWKGAVPGTFPTTPAVSGSGRGGRNFTQQSMEMASAVDFKRHIEALHYLLQLWPVPAERLMDQSLYSPEEEEIPALDSQNPLHCHARRTALHMDLPLQQDSAVVSRRGRGRLESPPCNRYAGDWSVCGRDFLSNEDADYDEVAGSESDDEEERVKKKDWAYADDFALDFDAPFTCRLSLKDFDNLISDLERELAKQINICL
ncbi:rho GTPase-activating protein SYDE1 [Trichomycterus rosablanca]|uniref:rho GTPase-activating protein SYDE1 n=1 Tax=Trichomycterus rosablanca TaxID=2290929 RepID=UPI002F3529CC